MSRKLTRLESEFETKIAQLNELEKEIRAIGNKIATTTAMYPVGTVITWNEGENIRRGMVREILNSFKRDLSHTTYMVTLIRRNGTWGMEKKIEDFMMGYMSVELSDDQSKPKGSPV